MRRQDLLGLILLAAIWGGSYALMRVVAPVLGGMGTAWIRMLTGGLLLCCYALLVGSPLGMRKWWKQYLFFGALSSAIPFSLIGYGMKTLPASYGAVLNALSPLFGALFSAALLGERLSRRKLAGIALGFIGVAILVRLGPVAITTELLLAAGACILATASYGYFAVHTKKHLGDAPNTGLAAGTLLLPALPLTLFAAPSLPTAWPPTTVVLATAALAVVCSGIAYVIYFKLIRDIGPTKAISVTFLIPVFGVGWGVVFLGETVDLTTLLGAGTILAGMSLVLGVAPNREASHAA
ncbi:MAG: EamA family transporter [Betaproteobacteria bacterium]|nr:EamA family transporter [Betaproteobacteria bacterium]